MPSIKAYFRRPRSLLRLSSGLVVSSGGAKLAFEFFSCSRGSKLPDKVNGAVLSEDPFVDIDGDGLRHLPFDKRLSRFRRAVNSGMAMPIVR